MMYIEDLIILLESNRLNRNFYELLDIRNEKETDVGKRIGNFFESLNSFTQADWRKILCYIRTNDAYCTNIVDTVLRLNIDATKQFLKDLRSFSKSHHRIYRRFKHAGFPIRYAGKMDLHTFFPTSNEFYTDIFVGKDILKDIAFLPFSEEIIESYKILIPSLQVFLKDMLLYRINCILKNVKGIIPLENFLNPYEAKKYEEPYVQAFQKFELAHPKKFFDLNIISKINNSFLKEMNWYTDFDKNRKRWKDNNARSKRFAEDNKAG